jgi:1,2-diacylglycerol 3-alpha-glucosyltransferase
MPETATLISTSQPITHATSRECRVAVIWIDWYAYHVARFMGIASAPSLAGKVAGVELVGGVGVHTGLKFREELPADLPVVTMMPTSGWQEAGQLRLAAKLWRHLDQLQPEILLVPGYYTLPALAAALWARVHRKVNVLMTESTAEDHARVWWKETAKGLLIRSLFDWAVAGGKAHRRYLSLLGFPQDRIANFYDVVDNDGFRRNSLLLRENSADEYDLPQYYFLYIGRLAPEKNIDGLLASWIAYRKSGGTWSLVLVGDGPCANELRRIVNASDYRSDARFVGHRGSSELPVYYAFASCFVLPSTREPWGLVVNEAMASGLPVLVSARCGCTEDLVIEGQNGFTFDPFQAQDLTVKLGCIEALTPQQRRAMADASTKIIRDYSPKHLGEEIGKIYDSQLR